MAVDPPWELRSDVQAKESEVEQYRASTGLVSTQGAFLIEQQITDAQTSLMQARADQAERQARYSQLQDLINAGGSADTLATVLNSVVICQLRSQEATVARQLADYQNRYGEAHPAIANVRAELADIREPDHGRNPPHSSWHAQRSSTSLPHASRKRKRRSTACVPRLDWRRPGNGSPAGTRARGRSRANRL